MLKFSDAAILAITRITSRFVSESQRNGIKIKWAVNTDLILQCEIGTSEGLSAVVSRTVTAIICH